MRYKGIYVLYLILPICIIEIITKVENLNINIKSLIILVRDDLKMLNQL